MANYIQIAKDLAKKFAKMDVSGGGLGAQIGDMIKNYDAFNKQSALDDIIKKLNLQQSQKSEIATFIKNHKLNDAKVITIDSLIDSMIAGDNANDIIYEALGPVVTSPDNTAVSIDTQKRMPSTTTNPKGPLSMPVDIGTYPIDPKDALKILFFKLASGMESFTANLIAFYPESEDVQYKTQDFISNTAERINTVISGMSLGEDRYTSLAWVAFAYAAEQVNMPLLRNVLTGEYTGEYWLVAYGKAVYGDEDGISSDRFDADYRTFRSMINDYDLEDLIKFSSVLDAKAEPASEEAEVEPNVTTNTVGASEKTEDTDSILNNDATYSVPTELGISVDDVLDRIKDASTKEVEGKNPEYRFTPTGALKDRLQNLESASLASRVFYREEIKSLKDELKIRVKEDMTDAPTTGTTMEIDPAAKKDDVNPNEDKPFKDSGAASDPTKASMSTPADIGSEINKAIDNIDNMSADEILDSIAFNLSGFNRF